MAAVLIDLSNYDSLLVQSTVGRSGSPDGNVFFDVAANKIEFITNDGDGLTQIDLTSKGGGATDENQLYTTTGIKFEAIYAFENQERRIDETLRKYNRTSSGTFKFGGAYNFVNDNVPSAAEDVAIIRGSGWNELDIDGVVQKIYFGNKGLSNIESGSQPYYQLDSNAVPVLNDIVPVDFSKVGQIDEAVLVYVDAGLDTRAYEGVSVRTFGQNYDRKETVADLGIAELGGYSTGFALNESSHLTSGDYTLSDVYTAPIAPWDTMTLEKLATPLARTEFSDPTSCDFTWVLKNPGTGSDAVPVSQGGVYQMVAFLDALSQDDVDIDSGSETVTYGKRVGTWYYYNATGQVVTRSGADSLGLYMYNVPVADQQLVVMTDDLGVVKDYSFSVSVEANVGATAKGDAQAWYHSFFEAAYNTSGAITVEDSSTDPVKGLASSADGNNKVIFAFDYTGDTVGGSADSDKDCVFLCEGDGGATQAKVLYTITKITTVAFSCAPPVENNA